MSNENESNAFVGIEKLDEFTRQEIIDNAQLQVDAVNNSTKAAILAARQAECSQAVSEAIAKAGHIGRRQRYDLIAKVRRQFGFNQFDGGN